MSVEPVDHLQKRIEAARVKALNPSPRIVLVAVSKTRTVQEIQYVMEQGVRAFGENKLQEAESKISQIGDCVEWHYIGRIQQNKINRIFSVFNVVQSVDRLPVLEKAQKYLEETNQQKSVYLQVNIAKEAQKAGFEFDYVSDFFRTEMNKAYPNIQFKGLMCIGPHTQDSDKIFRCFVRMRHLFDECQKFCPTLEYCSMGMSGDFELAVKAGSNMVRIGSAIFGPRIS